MVINLNNLNMNLKRIIKEEILKEVTSDSSSFIIHHTTGTHSSGVYVAPMRPGLRLFDPEQLQPFTVDTSKYDSALLNYDSLDGKMDEPKKVIKKIERLAKKTSLYAKKHPTQSDDSGDVINPFIGKEKKSNIKKTIKEELLKEAGGYDAPDIMGQHVGHVMSNLRDTLGQLNLGILGFSDMLKSDEINHLDIQEEIKELMNLIEESIMIIELSLKDFTEDELVLKGMSLLKSLNNFLKKIRIMGISRFEVGSKNYINNLVNELVTLSKSIRVFVKMFIETDKMFTQRLQGKNRGWYGGQPNVN